MVKWQSRAERSLIVVLLSDAAKQSKRKTKHSLTDDAHVWPLMYSFFARRPKIWTFESKYSSTARWEKRKVFLRQEKLNETHLFAWKLESDMQCAGAPSCQTSKALSVHAQDLTQDNFCIFFSERIWCCLGDAHRNWLHILIWKWARISKKLSRQSLP